MPTKIPTDSEISDVMIEILKIPTNRGQCGTCNGGKCGLEAADFNQQVQQNFPGQEVHVGARMFLLQAKPPFEIVDSNFAGDIAICYDAQQDTTSFALSPTHGTDLSKSPTKSEVVDSIADKTGLTKTAVEMVLDTLVAEIGKAVSLSGPGKFTMSNLFTIEVDRTSNAPEVLVNMRALKRFRDMANS